MAGPAHNLIRPRNKSDDTGRPAAATLLGRARPKQERSLRNDRSPRANGDAGTCAPVQIRLIQTLIELLPGSSAPDRDNRQLQTDKTPVIPFRLWERQSVSLDNAWKPW